MRVVRGAGIQMKLVLHFVLLAWLVAAPSMVRGGDSEFFIREGDHVVFLGDSITEQRLYTTYVEVYVLTRFPKWNLTFRNAGWGGDTAWLRQRAHPDEQALFAADPTNQQRMIEASVGAGLGRDVLPLNPTVVTIDFGMNDHAYQAFREDIFRAYIRAQGESVKVLQAHGARVALLTPQPIEERGSDPEKDVRNQSLRKFSDGLKELAATQGVWYVDQFDPYMAILRDARATNAAAVIGGGDAVHPGPVGHTLMAWAILKGLGAPARVSSVQLDMTRNLRSKVIRADGCRVTEVHYANGMLSFNRVDQGLPMPIDPRATSALKLAPILDDLSRYELKITGLWAGRYDVTMDGEHVATITAEELAAGWNMSGIATPVQKQVQQVLALVFRKNDIYFKRWRNMQLGAGTPAQLQELDQQITDLETQINAARQPNPHHVEIRPAS